MKWVAGGRREEGGSFDENRRLVNAGSAAVTGVFWL
jgi:hypothetical protein